MPWLVEILNDKVEAELNGFAADMRARFTRIVELIETFGLQNVGMPHVRHLREKLWEMRLKGRDGIGRALCISLEGERVIVLRAFIKKSQKTPVREIRLAMERAKEITK
jgi:phage-related protein